MWKNETTACPFYQRLIPFLGLLLYLFSATSSFGACVTQTGTIFPSVSSVCVNTNLVTLTLSGHSGNVLYWESTTDLTNYQRINSTSTSISISGIGATTYVRANVSSLNCFTANSTLATITSFIVSQGGNTTGVATVCANENSGNVVVNGFTGSVLGWMYSTNNFQTYSLNATTSPSIAYLNIATTTGYRALVKNGPCPVATSSTTIISTIQTDIGNFVTPLITTCGGNPGGTLVYGPNGSSNIVKWQYSSDNFIADIQDINSTNTNISYPALFNSRYYRVQVKNSTCSTKYSNSFKIQIRDEGQAGTILGSDNLCASISGSGTLTLSGAAGTIIKWQQSNDNFSSNAVDILNTSTTFSYSNLTQSTWYRAISTGNSCPISYSTIGYIIINGSAGVPGKISPKSYSFCTVSNTSNFTLNGYVGSINHWESSTNRNFISPTILSNSTTSSITVSNLSTVTYFRAVVGSVSCPTAYSDTVRVTATPVQGGILDLADSVVCQNDPNPGLNVAILNQIGQIKSWVVDTDPLFGTIGNEKFTSVNPYPVGALSALTYYKANIINGSCSTSTNVRRIRVDSLTQGGTATLGLTGTLCITSNSGTIILNNYKGSVIYWEKWPTGNYALRQPILNTTASVFGIVGTATTTSYAARLQNGECPQALSQEVNVKIDSLTRPGSLVLSSSLPKCSGDNVTQISVTGTNGIANRWLTSKDNFNTIDQDIASNSNVFTLSNITNDTQIKAWVQNGACPASVTGLVALSVVSAPVGGTISGQTEVCTGNNVLLNLTNQNSPIVYYYTSPYPDSTFTSANADRQTWNLASYTLQNLTKDTYFKFSVAKQFCTAPGFSNTHFIKVSQPSVGGSVLGTATTISNLPTTVTLTGNLGNVIQWETATSSSFATKNSFLQTNTTFGLASIGGSIFIRAVVQSGSCAAQTSTPLFIVSLAPISCRDTSFVLTVGQSSISDPKLNLSKLTNYATSLGIINVQNTKGISTKNKPYEIFSSGLFNYYSNPDSLTDAFTFTTCITTVSPFNCKTCQVKVKILDTLQQVIVYTTISPNKDGINDEWLIDNISDYPENKVSIYNRWGNIVYQTKGYDNVNQVFKGRSNTGIVAGGDELPSATYYYVIELGQSLPIRKGYIVLNR